MKHLITTLCACAAIFGVSAAEYVRPEVVIRPADQKCPEECSPLCGNIFRAQAWKLEDFNRLPSEQTALRCSMDKDNLYIELYMEDKDILSEALNNKSPKLYNIADAVQILLHCEKQPNIWEINVTSNSMSNCFLMPGGGAPLPICSEKFNYKYEVKVDGTLNDSKDIDKSWSAKVTVPLSELRRKGLLFTESENWTILVYRNNYGRYLAGREHSCFPQTLRNVYETARFAKLVFPKAK